MQYIVAPLNGLGGMTRQKLLTVYDMEKKYCGSLKLDNLQGLCEMWKDGGANLSYGEGSWHGLHQLPEIVLHEFHDHVYIIQALADHHLAHVHDVLVLEAQ